MKIAFTGGMNTAFFARARNALQDFPSPLKYLACFLAGLVMVLAMPPFGLWPVLLIGFPVFYVLLDSIAPGWRSALAGWLFGFGYFGAGLYWIGNALLVDGNNFAWVWPFAIAGLPALLACFTAVATWAARRFGRLHRAAGFIMFCVIFAGFEWLRGHLFTGYPWNLYGYTWANFLPVAQFAAFGGSYMLSGLTIVWAALPGFIWLGEGTPAHKARVLVLGFVSFGLVLGLGAVRLHYKPTMLRDDILVRAVQPNIAQADKWNMRKAVQNYEKLLILSEPNAENMDKTTILIWPETAVPTFLMHDVSAQAALRAVLNEYEMPVYLIAGTMRVEPGATEDDTRYYNSLVMVNRDGERLATYDKAHLVPFGEYVPFSTILPLPAFVSMSGFNAGDGPQTLTVQGVPPFSPLICYEVIFPGAVKDRQGDRPAWLVNITNDAWYGDSPGPRQHFAMSIFRAIEEGLPVIRSANTGISGVVDPLGRVLHRAPLMTEDGTNAALPHGLEPAPLYSRYGDLPLGVTLVIFAFLALYLRRQT